MKKLTNREKNDIKNLKIWGKEDGKNLDDLWNPLGGFDTKQEKAIYTNAYRNAIYMTTNNNRK